MDFGVVDIARCLGQETQTFHCKVRSNPRRNTSNNGVRSWSSTHFEQLVALVVKKDREISIGKMPTKSETSF
jgi:hypothetical protein